MLNHHFEVNRTNLDHIIEFEVLRLTWMNAGAIQEGSVGTVQILQGQVPILEKDQGMLAGTPDLIWRFLIFQINVHWFFIRTPDEILAFVNREFDVELLTANNL